MEDILAWHFDSKGVFSVKSAYHTLDEDRARNAVWQDGEGSTSAGHAVTNGFKWKKLWKLNCPPKVKHFFWRFALNSLPVRRNISRRGMEIDTKCPVCLRLDEDGGHYFLKCKFAKRVLESTKSGRGEGEAVYAIFIYAGFRAHYVPA